MGPAITILRKERNAGMRVGILSDTHGLLRSEVKEVLRTCDVILHGGDINRETIIKELEELAPLHVVRGNNDKEWAEGMPEELSFSLEGVSFYMIHNKKEASPEAVSDADVVLYGHSHRYDERDYRRNALAESGKLWAEAVSPAHHHGGNDPGRRNIPGGKAGICP